MKRTSSILHAVHEHCCEDVENFPADKFLQQGQGAGARVLILGEAPAANGWRKSGRAFYTVDGKLLPTGKNLNVLLKTFGLSVEECSFTELIKCYVGQDRRLLDSCGQKCWPVFVRQLEHLDCQLIVLLGVQTLKVFNEQLGLNLKVGEVSAVKIHGRQYQVLSIYHPSPVGPLNHQKNIEIFAKSEVAAFFAEVS